MALTGCPKAEVEVGPKEIPTSVEHGEVLEVSRMVADFDIRIDTNRLTVEVADEATARADGASALDIAFRKAHFDIMLHLRRILEARPRYARVERLREVIAEARLPLQPVYYAEGRKALVFRQQWQADLAAIRPWTAHQLVYAAHDQAPGGIVTLLADQGQRVDSIRVRQCLLEGQARLVEVAAALAADGHTLHDVNVDQVVQAPTSFAGGEIDTPCAAGVRFLMRKYLEHGWENVSLGVRQAPDSSEQLLHPEKIGVDFPSNVGLPRWPRSAGEATLAYDDVLGELSIYRLLRERGVDDGPASVAAVGWDGDRINVFALPSGKRVTAWRTVWDRDADAHQFAAAISPRTLEDPFVFSVVQTGRVVDCLSSDSPAIAKALGDAMAKTTRMGEPEAADVTSTARIEAALAKAGVSLEPVPVMTPPRPPDSPQPTDEDPE